MNKVVKITENKKTTGCENKTQRTKKTSKLSLNKD